MTDIEIRRKILEALYAKHRKDAGAYVMNTELRDIVGCSLSELESNISYLEEKNYVQVEWTFDGKFAARIRAEGIDFLQDENASKSPQTYVHVEQKHYGEGPMIGYVGPGSNIEIVEDSFTTIYKELGKRDLQEKEKLTVEEKVGELKEELKKDNPSRDKISRIVDFLKSNASWIVPTVEKVIERILGTTRSA